MAEAAWLALLLTAPGVQAEIRIEEAFGIVTEVYGRAHFTMDAMDNGEQQTQSNLSSNFSRIGIRGSRDFEDLQALWQIETEVVSILNKDNNKPRTKIGSRDTFVGLQSRWGLLRMGKFDTPFKRAREPFNLFGDQMGDMRNITRVGEAKFDERLKQAIEYQSPSHSGLSGRLAYSPNQVVESPGDGDDTGTDDAVTSLALFYRSGPLYATFAFEGYGPATNKTGRRHATRMAAAYQLDPHTRLVAFHQNTDSRILPAPGRAEINESGRTSGIGVEYTFHEKWIFRTHLIGRLAEADGSDSKLFAVGLEYVYAPNLRFYTSHGRVANDTNASQVPWREGRTAKLPGVPGRRAVGTSVGVRYDF